MMYGDRNTPLGSQKDVDLVEDSQSIDGTLRNAFARFHGECRRVGGPAPSAALVSAMVRDERMQTLERGFVLMLQIECELAARFDAFVEREEAE
jgi:hypothetical protein